MSGAMRVEFVRAGAGSGKTYYLTNLLAERLGNGAARPHAVIATTFTVKAATELRERARATLLKAGRLDLSAAIGQSRIGTVNSVCGQLIQRFCFELGISPDQTVLEEEGAARLMRVAIDNVQTPEAGAELLAVAARLSLSDQLTKHVQDIVAAARANNLDAAQVAGMGAANANAMLACWPDPSGDHTPALEAALAAAEVQLEAAVAAGNRTKVLADGLEAVRRAGERLGQGVLTWADWHTLETVQAGAQQAQILSAVGDAARRHTAHSHFHADVRYYLESVFGLASAAMQAFADAKRELGVVDFTDQEVMLLQAIRESELVREALADELDLVLVDEFQDTNPLQLAIFVELAKLSKASVWVGDQKQAIYGFRGTDSNLIQQILGAVEGWGGTLGDPLSTSWRSTPELVALANSAFVPAFAPTPAAEVALAPARTSIPGQPALINWGFNLPPKKRALDVTAIGPAITQLLERGFQVQDKQTGQLRPMVASDIAVLCRANATVPKVVQSLSRWGIPAAAERPGLLSTPEAQLVLACLRRMFDRNDTVASATIIGLTSSLEPEQWLHDRLQFLAGVVVDADGHNVPPIWSWKVRGEDAHPLLARLEGLRPRLLSLTPREALRLAKAESGIAQLAHRWSANERSAQVRLANVEALLALATEYEEARLGARQPATVNGLLLWLQERADEAKDGRAAAANGAVEVMTFHRAKGLEWPVVIVAGVDHAHRTDLWSVRARTSGAFDAEQPLANRFIHLWPQPYGMARNVGAVANAEASDLGLVMDREALHENTRLLYVTLTRARDLLVLVGANQRGMAPPAAWLDEIGATEALWGPTATLTLGEVPVQREASEWTVAAANAAPPAPTPQQLRFIPAGAPRDHGRLWFAPSAANAQGYRVLEIEDVGTRIAVRAGTDFAALGSAVHACIAFATSNAQHPPTVEEVGEVLTRWGVENAADPAEVLAQLEEFGRWWRRKWPQAEALPEVPLEVRRGDGVIVRGQIDLLLKNAGRRVVIDHKADPRAVGEGDRLAVAHGGQLAAYADAVSLATGDAVDETWLFLPVAAKAVRIGR